MKRRTPTYDERCYELAATFLADEEDWFEQSLQYREETTARIAALLQSTLEDEIIFNVRKELVHK